MDECALIGMLIFLIATGPLFLFCVFICIMHFWCEFSTKKRRKKAEREHNEWKRSKNLP